MSSQPFLRSSNNSARYGFPRYTHPEVAIAYSFDSFIDSHPNVPSNTTLQDFKPPYTEQVQGAFEPFFRANLDTAIINIGHENLSSYKLLVVPADYVMDSASAAAIRGVCKQWRHSVDDRILSQSG